MPTPPYTKADLKALDRWHQREGTYEEWMMSKERADIAGPKNVVRVINWVNLHDVCKRAGLDEHKVALAYREAVKTGDVLFVEYEEE